jgi:hypothetical protein
LAEHRSIPVVPRTDVRDARTICGPDDTPVIEYNPNRPKARIRFSICHELAHTLFPECTREVRNRLYHAETTPVSYELEMLWEILCTMVAQNGDLNERRRERCPGAQVSLKNVRQKSPTENSKREIERFMQLRVCGIGQIHPQE